MLNDLIINARNKQKQRLDRIHLLEEKKEVIELKIEKEWHKNFSDIKLIYKPLAEAICQKMGIKYYQIYGPFGLDCETSIFFSNESEKPSKSEKFGICRPIDICNVDTYGLYDLVVRGENQMEIHYATGEETNEFAKDSIGYLNGFNRVRKLLPDNLDEIIKVLRFSPAKKKEK